MDLLNNIISGILNPIIVLLFAVAFLAFLWGVFNFVSSSDSDEGKQKGSRHMMWGVIGIFIMVSVMGIIEILKSTIESFN